ncbi:unannotated protein [freshwater metagenome]|jgi:predicted GH43/DUF377 family glycosyl hydrolase|uniref:Unannotated protein n=1 Tax=freshwater metagenome TaxID=449393 RepID=A0A6J6WDU5_9ZZZZ|nr:hypothetical protein [Actinomycetota bacterium]MTB29492.1 hypothetical protein [Actinomycetota bacterium]MUH48959.1 hypothetical protein [Actinomycetota bacterium]
MSTYNDILREKYLEAFNQEIREEISGLTEGQFINRYDASKPWSVGPFSKCDPLTFRKTSQMPDPTGIEWTSSSIFNPSIIEKDGKLFLFYRAAVKKESLGSRIGLAIYTPGTGWEESSSNPVMYPSQANEILSVEDPKVYKYGNDQYIMFYNGVWSASDEEVQNYEKEYGAIAVDINYALSSDLIHWEKKGLVVPYDISKLWAKGAVIPRDASGAAVKINGEYLMFISEGCGGKQVIGHSPDMITWSFEVRTYLNLPESMGTHIYEVATAVIDGENMILDFMYNSHTDEHLGAQALYSLSNITEPKEFSDNSTLAWGGMIAYQGDWLFAQGWDAPAGSEEIYFYSAKKS